MYKPVVWQTLRLLLVIVGFIAVGMFFIYIFRFIYPLIFAAIISILIHPVVSFLENKARLPRFISIFVTIIGLLVFCFGLLLLIITEVYQGSLFLAEQIPKHFHSFVFILENLFSNHLLPVYQKVMSFFHTLDPNQQSTINEYIRSLSDFVASSGADILQNSLAKIPDLLAVVPGSITTIIFILLAAFMITNDYENLKQLTEKMMPFRAGKTIQELFNHFKLAVSGYFRAQLTLMFISVCIILAGLLVLQVDHALTIVLFAAALDLIPFIGTGIIFIPWILYLYAVSDYHLTIGLCILYMIVIISRQILEPKILSSKIGIHPLAVLVGMFIGIQIWGVAGVLIAPLLIVLGNALQQSGILQIIWKFVKG
ncbi:sporulation integral membrane protein YtvI [Oceanobacillus damuensis]|uniref:sporulation integral membrane protein YtvI n=1 Tax=Oceanobacillus damuensis TaxID=937928 RepID=UPI000829BC38|nr:sporulation integral membrane protein YtvI [Oceanobacillus damuensis]